MDTSNIPAAGSKPTKQTFDQAPVTRQLINSPPPVQQPQIQSVHPKTDIFSIETQVNKQQEIRQNQNFKLNFFHQNPFKMFLPPQQGRNTQTFETSQQGVKRQQKQIMIQQFKKYFQIKLDIINYNRQVDHGKEFLFGKSDLDEYKSLKRAVTLNELNPKEVQSSQKSKKQQQLQQDQNPSNRKQMENQSSVFLLILQNNCQYIQLVEKLTSSTQKWSTVGGQSNNQVKEFDPETYAKNRKEAQLQSSVFGEQSVYQSIICLNYRILRRI